MSAINKLDLHLRDYGVSVSVDLSQIPEVSDEVQALFSRIHHAPPPNVHNADITAKKEIQNLTRQIATHQTSFCKMILPTMHLIANGMLTAGCIFFLIAPFTLLGFPLWFGILCAVNTYMHQICLNTLLLKPERDATLIGGITQQCNIAQIRDLQEGFRAFQRSPQGRFQQSPYYSFHLCFNPFFHYLEFARISCFGWNKILRHQDKVIQEQTETILLESVRYYTSYSDELRDVLVTLEDEHRDLALEQLETVSRFYTQLSKQLRNKVMPLVTDKNRAPRFHPGVDGLILEYALF